ncbi:MAG: adenylosuccinate lyase [Bacteroides sp.]|jgi:adenylosuccinate lyase|nr:adenylosuccinate lyase [Bacteroides sp.]
MKEAGLSCISPIDGRYRKTTAALSPFFSELALIRYRLMVELAYFEALYNIPLPELKGLPAESLKELKKLNLNFSESDAIQVKDIEAKTNHDIKAVEYFLKEHFDRLGLQEYREFVHFGLTSQDINNTAIPLSLKEGLEQVIYPVVENLLKKLHDLAIQWKDVPMLARTHGQPASPTLLGKEILVFHERIRLQFEQLKAISFPAKFGGATGNFNAHHVAYPGIDWMAFAEKFTASLGLKRSCPTTQIDHYDLLAAIFDNLKRICTIIIDLDRDFWTYISMEYFRQKVVKGEVGSSAMPHKVNPIDFENAEGNAGVAIALFEHLSAKLPISRLQRDLTDSTVLRNMGVPLAHLLIALKSTLRGLDKVSLNPEALDQDLEKNSAVVAEAIQTILRKIRYPEPYEKLKDLTRNNQPITREALDQFIDSLDISEEQKENLKQITPFNYTGIKPKALE